MPRRKELMPVDEAVLDFVIDYKLSHCGNSPSIREIGKFVDDQSTSHVKYILKKLSYFGKIDYSDRVSRNITIPGMKITFQNAEHRADI